MSRSLSRISRKPFATEALSLLWRQLRLSGVAIRSIDHQEDGIVIVAESSRRSAECPLCGTVSHRVHSRYVRRPMDLPVDERKVRLHLQTRRFVCARKTCHRKIFCERLPQLIRPHAQRTLRLDSLLTHVGILLGGEAGSRLTYELNAPVSPDTLLRLVMAIDIKTVDQFRIVGIDEWAWRRGHTYGTIVCDLERHRPVDLLPDARSETIARWLRSHPTIEVVSRDRSGAFADASRVGAPGAVQVADRWHLLKNLGDVTERFLRTISLPPVQTRNSTPDTNQHSAPQKNALTQRELARREADTRRRARYEHVVTLYNELRSIRAVANKTGLSRQTIRKYLDAPSYPERHSRQRGPSLLDPYRTYIVDRWNAGCKNSAQIFREIKELGYIGSGTLVRHYVATLRHGSTKDVKDKGMDSIRDNLDKIGEVKPSPKRVRWLFTRPQEKLSDDQVQYLERLFGVEPKAHMVYQLVQDFRQIVSGQNIDGFYPWLEKAMQSRIRVFRSFAQGLHRDKEAVMAAITYPWSNGQVEGHINRLKMLKRQMYGRAGIELLRRRFLATN